MESQTQSSSSAESLCGIQLSGEAQQTLAEMVEEVRGWSRATAESGDCLLNIIVEPSISRSERGVHCVELELSASRHLIVQHSTN